MPGLTSRPSRVIPVLGRWLRRQKSVEPFLEVGYFAMGASVVGIEHQGSAGLIDRLPPMSLHGGEVVGLPGVLCHLRKRCAQCEVGGRPIRITRDKEAGQG